MDHLFEAADSGDVFAHPRINNSAIYIKLTLTDNDIINMVKTQAGSNTSKHVWHGQDNEYPRDRPGQ